MTTLDGALLPTKDGNWGSVYDDGGCFPRSGLSVIMKGSIERHVVP
jgi:hypothetical protein